VRGVVSEVRDTLYDLRTDVSEESDLPTTLAAHAERVQERSKVQMRMDFKCDARLPLPAIGLPDALAKTKWAPSAGWPANGISRSREKMRRRKSAPGLAAGSMNAVAAWSISRAISWRVSSSRPEASGNTASGLPASGRSAKTSTRT